MRLDGGMAAMGPKADWDAALFAAVQEGDLAKAGDALASGADVDYAGMQEGTPLMLAAFMGQLDFLRLFLAAGADANLALHRGGETALHMAAVAGRTAAVKELLDGGAVPNMSVRSGVVTHMLDGGAKVWGESPLNYAAAYGDEEMARAMLLAGADKQAANAHGETPLEYAGRHKRPRAIRDLLKSLLTVG